jgi:hypothetical protein
VTADGTRHNNDKWVWNRPRDISFELVGPTVPDTVVVAIVRTWSGLNGRETTSRGDVIWFVEHAVDHSAARQVVPDVVLGTYNPDIRLQTWLSSSLLNTAFHSQADSVAFLSASFGASERSGDLRVAVFSVDQWATMLVEQAEAAALWEELPVTSQPTFALTAAAAVGGSFSILFQGCTTTRPLTVLDSEDDPVGAMGTSSTLHVSVGMCMPVAMCGAITTGRSTGLAVGDAPCQWVDGVSAGARPASEDVCCDVNPRSSLETKGFADDDSFRSFLDVLASDVVSFTLGTTVASWLGLVDAEGLMFTLPGNSASGSAIDWTTRLAEADGLTGDEFLATFVGSSNLLRNEARLAAAREYDGDDGPQRKRQAAGSAAGGVYIGGSVQTSTQWIDDLRLLEQVGREYSLIWDGPTSGYRYSDPGAVGDVVAILDDIARNYDDILAFLQRTSPASAAKFAELASDNFVGLHATVFSDAGATRPVPADVTVRSTLAEIRKLSKPSSLGEDAVTVGVRAFLSSNPSFGISTSLYHGTHTVADKALRVLLGNVPELAPTAASRPVYPWPASSRLPRIFARFDEAKLLKTVPDNMATAKVVRAVDWLVEDGKPVHLLVTHGAPWYPARLAPPPPGAFSRFVSSIFGCKKRGTCTLGAKSGTKIARSTTNLLAVGLSFDLALSAVHPSLGCGIDRTIGDGPSRCMQTMTIGSDILVSWTAAGWLGLDRADVLEEVGGSVWACRDDVESLPGASQVCWEVGVREDSWLPPSGLISSLYPESGTWVPLIGSGAVDGAYYLPGALHRFSLQFPDGGASVDSLPFVATAAGCEYDVSNRVVGVCIESAACEGHYGGFYRLAVQECGTSLVCCRDDRRLANDQFRVESPVEDDAGAGLTLGALIAVATSALFCICLCAVAAVVGMLLVRRNRRSTHDLCRTVSTSRAHHRHSRSASSLRRHPSSHSFRS